MCVCVCVFVCMCIIYMIYLIKNIEEAVKTISKQFFVLAV